ncbi:SCO2523 family variant P-loop protein [Dactylosporangium matsuzakiense]|uniref:DNA-binding protein n=1 Tax=Dactylosporangium matsuzakiense TaxID=53360 RepID=A0A9W6NKA0_9ACTN|nr:SCO2523 family variant P-loop protein [Dactylosporangium matsuzakiense]UWZ45872.1 ParA family protein [Dactylosporangium matsuzakiense]GLL00089.1 DNA-binding protein [Dactylosporangium matsuzakiense]
MLLFAASDKGGTGRSVTSCNVAFRSALANREVCYLDFDFGSPTAGEIFGIEGVSNGTRSGGGLHSYLQGRVANPERLDVWGASERSSLRLRPAGAGQLALFPGDASGSEFPTTAEMVKLCAELFLRLEEQFDVVIVDLSAGRSYATELALKATTLPSMRKILSRWLVFHRWTNQHVNAAAGLVNNPGGILELGARCGHDRDDLQNRLRFVRTAVIDPFAEDISILRPSQIAFLRDSNAKLIELASSLRIGRTTVLAQIPLDPLLQWREQLISDNDLYERKIANQATVEAFEKLARDVIDDDAWEVL